MIPHLVLVLYILSILPGIEFEGPVTDAALHCGIEFRRVLWCHDESLVIGVVFDGNLLELAHATDELLHAIRSMDDAIRFVEFGEVALDFLAHSAWTMLRLEMPFVPARWTCFFGLDEGLEVRVVDEG